MQIRPDDCVRLDLFTNETHFNVLKKNSKISCVIVTK